MLKQLFFKELKLVLNPSVYFLLPCAAILLIPNGNYPYILAVSYILICFVNTFIIARANNDFVFTAMLPVSRRDIVLSKHMLVWFVELLQLVIALPFALISFFVINPNGNALGIDANFSFFGIALMCYAVFNLIFLTMYFKTGYKCGVPLLLGVAGYICVYAAAEILMSFTAAGIYIDGVAPEFVGYRIAVFAVGAVLFALLGFVSCKISVKKFGKVSL